MKQIHSAGVVLFSNENSTIKYLLLHYCDGHWDFPKGKIEKKETKKQAALRELYEETGLTAIIKEGFKVSTSYFFHDRTAKKIKKTVYFFVGKVEENQQVKLSHEHKDFKWLPFDQAQDQLTYVNAKEILFKANNFIENL